MSAHTSTDLVRLLAEGKTYLWALRQAQRGDLTPELLAELTEHYANDGIDTSTLAALRQLEYSIARFTYPAARKVRHDEYIEFGLPGHPGLLLPFNEVICEHGLELGVELFPGRIQWTFPHKEVQYYTGGDSTWEIIDVDDSTQTRRARPGDVAAYPSGTQWTCDSGEGDGRFANAHIFLLNLGEGEAQLFYDGPGVMRLQALGLVPTPDGEAPTFTDASERVEVKDWSQLLTVHPDRERDLPTWLRNGWAAREATRALDYAEGTRRSVLTAPDRAPADFIPWSEGRNRCYVNPLIAEETAGITDCRLPAGYERALPRRELWCVLCGQARLRQSIPAFHAEWVEYDVEPGWAMAVASGARVVVEDASDDFVVRRMAETCAHNGHAWMMERKLLEDGVDREL